MEENYQYGYNKYMMKYSVKCPKTHSEFYKLLSIISEIIEIVSGQNY